MLGTMIVERRSPPPPARQNGRDIGTRHRAESSVMLVDQPMYDRNRLVASLEMLLGRCATEGSIEPTSDACRRSQRVAAWAADHGLLIAGYDLEPQGGVRLWIDSRVGPRSLCITSWNDGFDSLDFVDYDGGVRLDWNQADDRELGLSFLATADKARDRSN
jgi:hypothetical protein